MVRPSIVTITIHSANEPCRDRRKLTFYFVSDRRIDFRELVRELFRYEFLQALRYTFLIISLSDFIKLAFGWLAYRAQPALMLETCHSSCNLLPHVLGRRTVLERHTTPLCVVICEYPFSVRIIVHKSCRTV